MSTDSPKGRDVTGREIDDRAWRFQHMDQLLPSQTIKRGEKTSPLEYKPVSFEDFSIEDSDGGSLDLSSFLEQTETDGLIVLHDGAIVFEYYGRGNDEDSVHAMMSMTKSVVGLVAGVLVGQGKLDVNQLVSKYVLEIIGTPYENVSIQSCLDMRSGLQYNNDDPAYRKASGILPLREDEQPTDLHHLLSNLQAPLAEPVDGQEDAPLNYLSINSDLIGWVLERASDQTFANLLFSTLWQPMGAQSEAYVLTDPSGNARTSGGLCATLRDIARLGQQLLLPPTTTTTSNPIPASWIHDILHAGSAPHFTASTFQPSLRTHFHTLAYRSYWLADSATETLIAIGIHGQMMLVDRGKGMVMVKLSSQPGRAEEGKKGLAVRAFGEFGRILGGRDGEGGERGEEAGGEASGGGRMESVDGGVRRSCYEVLRRLVSWLRGGG